MTLGRIIAAVLPIAVVAVATSAVAAGGEEDGARIHFEQGVKLYEDGQYEQAAIAFARAYELKPSFKLLYNIGQAESELKHYARALEAFTRYLAEGGDQVPPERVTAVKSEIERLNALVGMIVVECPVTGARVLLDNENKGEIPLGSPIFVDIGKHEVVIKHGQEELLREVVRVAGGQRVTLEVEAGAGATGEPAVDAPDDGGDSDGGGRVWTWVALGVGCAAGIAGAAIGGAAMSKRSDLEDSCVDSHCPPSRADEADTIEKLNLTADVLFGVAAAGVVTGVILFFVEPDDEPETAVAVTPAVTASGAGLAVGGRF